jgi:hypothetical protein
MSVRRARLRPYYAELDIDPDDVPPAPTRAPFTHDAADVIEPFRPPVVSFHDAIVAQGIEARARHREPADARPRNVEQRPRIPARVRRARTIARGGRVAGEGRLSPLWAGQNTTGCKPIPAAHVTAELAAGIQ